MGGQGGAARFAGGNRLRTERASETARGGKGKGVEVLDGGGTAGHVIKAQAELSGGLSTIYTLMKRYDVSKYEKCDMKNEEQGAGYSTIFWANFLFFA